MDRPPLTRRQEQILRFVVDEIHQRRGAPTVREIGKRFGLSSSCTVYSHLKALQRKGYLTLSRTHRGIQPVDPQEEDGFPLVGRVAAGVPTLSEENLDGRVDLNRMFPSGPQTFLLRVKGESMRDAGIRDGDLAVVERRETARDGEVVVALVDGEATVKRFGRKAGQPVLFPENPEFAPILLGQAASASIVGRVVGVVRKL